MQERRAFYVVFAIAAALIVPAGLTLRTVVHPVVLQATSDNPTPLGYIWSDEYWMAEYIVRDYAATAKNIPRIVRFHFASVLLGILLIAAAIVYRKSFSGAREGFPWYFVYLVCASLTPSAGFFHTVRP